MHTSGTMPRSVKTERADDAATRKYDVRKRSRQGSALLRLGPEAATTTGDAPLTMHRARSMCLHIKNAFAIQREAKQLRVKSTSRPLSTAHFISRQTAASFSGNARAEGCHEAKIALHKPSSPSVSKSASESFDSLSAASKTMSHSLSASAKSGA